ncbi:MAG: ATP-binding protein [Parachlamydia sp.]|nr:MAG: ATP-binding protein [Parachlamydia sp.]
MKARLQISQSTYLIGSGKGGVGKSTVAVNLAVALAKKGLAVGLLDADLYGPSIPIMMGLRRLTPHIDVDYKGEETITPFYKFGVKIASLGFFMEEARSIVWRGPMLHGTLQKFIQNVFWGHLDVLLIDLPPGTGDVPLSLSQLLHIDGALVVSTPQEVAILDVIKVLNAFHQLEIPLIGLIENMAPFIAPDTGLKYALFGEGKVAELAQRFETSLLGSIPFNPMTRVGGDEGLPVALHDNAAGAPFHFLAEQLLAYA